MSHQPRHGLRLFLISFVILFFELVCIRWIPAHIRYMAYFSNVVLLACFLGIGTGCLVARRKIDLVNFFPLALYVAILTVVHFKFEARIVSPLALYFTESWRVIPTQKVESFLLLPLVFTVVTILFLLLSQEMGRLLRMLPPLQGYSFNILGSLTGIVIFSFLSFFLSSPWVPFIWLSILIVALLPFLKKRGMLCIINGAALFFCLLLVQGSSINGYWSVYYKITIHEDERVKDVYVINVNNISHQSLMDVRTNGFFYHFPYSLSKVPFENVLILGAGCGNDVATALMHGAKRIDAVEIDPFIQKLGKLGHPNQPYQSARVSVFIDDGRAFLRKSAATYDLIIYGLVDSLTLTSSFSNVRLENYLFTLESFQDAKRHLRPGGLLILYNYFREKWLVDKLTHMLEVAFGQRPSVYILPRFGNLAILVAGEDISRYALPIFSCNEEVRHLESSTDDWPFIYLQRRTVPIIYLKAIGIIALVSLLFIFSFLKGPARIDWHFFFLGAGFMLLETENIIRFGLLFGATWLVNSLVIAAILIGALLATFTVHLTKRSLLAPAYFLLFLLLIFNYVIPYGRLFVSNYAARYIVTSLFVFSPLFAAGIIFATSLRCSSNVEVAFGANLLGAMVGGMVEYLSLAVGYHRLQWVVMGFYVLSLVVITVRPKVDSHAPCLDGGRG